MNIKHNYKNKIWKCQYCGNNFTDRHACKTRIPKYCSRSCSAKVSSKILTEKRLKALELGRLSRPSFRKGKNITESHRLNISNGKKGVLFSDNHKQNLSEARKGKFIGENNPSWKGDKIGYGALHDWVHKVLGSPNRCEKCDLKNNDNRKVHWANKSGKYKRDKKDWIRLCVKCHKKFDIKKGKLKCQRQRAILTLTQS